MNTETKRLETMLDQLDDVGKVLDRQRALLVAVLDAGRPHSESCNCERCEVWLAIRKELKGK